MSLTTEQLKFYRKNGYLIAARLFSPEECDIILTAITLHANKDFAAIMNPDREEFLAKQSHGGSKQQILETSRLMRKTMCDRRIVSLLEDIYGGRSVVGLMSQVLFKHAKSPYANQAWNPHQDNSYPRNSKNLYINTEIFLADADKETGGLYVYPGSHAEPILESKPMVSYREQAGQSPGNLVIEVPARYKPLDLTLKKGDFLIQHGNLIHGSYPNISQTRSRPIYGIAYLPEGEDFIPGGTAQRMAIPLSEHGGVNVHGTKR